MERYEPKPWHLVFSVLLLFTGTLAVTWQSWYWFGITVFGIGIACAAWIVYAGLCEAYAGYWDSIGYFADIMNKNKNPDVWAALGFRMPRDSFNAKLDTGVPNYPSTSIYRLPVSEAKFQMFSDAMLMGVTMAESYWAGSNKTFSTPEYRKFVKAMEKEKLIRLKMVDAPRQGFVLTRKGKDLLQKYASPGILGSLLEQENRVAPGTFSPRLSSFPENPPTLSEG